MELWDIVIFIKLLWILEKLAYEQFTFLNQSQLFSKVIKKSV